ncbi:MAG TPA: FtsX-like permease family protein, partial [Gemmatimonadaceae bacterium]|nr:FtsX-like permease family protein [Gemmatimonadaceae bacterium]
TGWRGDLRGSPYAVEGRAYANRREYPRARSLAVTPGFFDAFAVKPLRGRGILATDQLDAPRVAVVNEAFVQRYFPRVDPIGRRVRTSSTDGDGEWLTIVGVMPTLYAASVVNAEEDHWPPVVLTAFWQEPRIAAANIALRGPESVASAATLRAAVRALDPDVPVHTTAMMHELITKSNWSVHLFGSMFVVFGVVSLALAAIGLYAVMAFSASRRVRELGVRMALGARNGDIVRAVGRQGVWQIAIGMSVGLLLGAALVRLVRSMLFEVEPTDPVVFAVVALVLGGAALVACLVPAVRATRVDPLVALRSE